MIKMMIGRLVRPRLAMAVFNRGPQSLEQRKLDMLEVDLARENPPPSKPEALFLDVSTVCYDLQTGVLKNV